ncbi:MAG TPA: ATP-binding cassette domain-containing protein [Bacteroidota bacterium]|nr:ATP-binding cassette domain-containing protein [Bacteroidota bacterium]
MLLATDLRKQYTAVVAVDGVSLRAERGRMLGLLGPNGAGKTTTIRMLLRIIPPDDGIITYDGLPYSEAVINRIGYLPEERGLYRKSRVLNTIVYFASLRGVPAPEAKSRAISWLERLEISHYAGSRMEELSKGNQQKIQFIIAVLHDPDYVVLDEPFSGLDPLNQGLLNGILQDLKQRGKSVIFSTHVMHQAEQLCDDICLIDGGKVVLEGDLNRIRAGFGRETAKIEFTGDPGVLDAIPNIRVVEKFANSAEVLFTDAGRTAEIVADLARRLDLRMFERRGPSLNTIFLETVRGRRGREGGAGK